MGLRQASMALERLGGSSFRRMLAQATKRPWQALGAGTLFAAVIQSGTALIVTVISLLEAKVVGFAAGLALSVGAILGATAALQLVAFRIFDLALPLVALGYFVSLWRPARNLGLAVSGVGLLFFGLELLVRAFSGMSSAPLFTLVVKMVAGSPWLLALIGFGFAALVQSANATAVLALGLVLSGALSLGLSLPLIIGGNVAATLPAVWASAGASTGARRVALGHLAFKALLGILFLLLLGPYIALVHAIGGGAAREVADAHTLFNLVAALFAVVLVRPMEQLMVRWMPERGGEITPRYLSEEALASPGLAFSLALREVVRISDQVLQMMSSCVRILSQGGGHVEALQIWEEKIDRLTHAVVLYLARLQGNYPESSTMSLLMLAGELEHLADQVRRLVKQQGHLQSKGLEFSLEGRAQLVDAATRVFNRMGRGFAALATGNEALVKQLLEEREASEIYLQRLRQAHLGRLESGLPQSRASSAAHLDMLMTLDVLDAGISRVVELALAVQVGRGAGGEAQVTRG